MKQLVQKFESVAVKYFNNKFFKNIPVIKHLLLAEILFNFKFGFKTE